MPYKRTPTPYVSMEAEAQAEREDVADGLHEAPGVQGYKPGSLNIAANSAANTIDQAPTAMTSRIHKPTISEVAPRSIENALNHTTHVQATSVAESHAATGTNTTHTPRFPTLNCTSTERIRLTFEARRLEMAARQGILLGPYRLRIDDKRKSGRKERLYDIRVLALPVPSEAEHECLLEDDNAGHIGVQEDSGERDGIGEDNDFGSDEDLFRA